MSSKLFTDFGLSPEMLKAIARLGFEQPSPIQAQTLPPLLEGKDLVGQSQTGSGKTAAFGIPIIERIKPEERAIQVLIICPTRELAVQVSEEIRKLSFFKPGIRPIPIYGGQSYDRQFAGLRAGANVVIGTPGRVMDHMKRGTLQLDKVRAVVLDEADEMLNMGFRDDIEFILKAVPAERQTVLFSATVPRAIEELISRYTREPVRIRIEGQAMTVPTVEQVYVEVDRRRKMETLGRLIDLHDIRYGIVFCNTQRMVDELAEHMNAAGYNADCIHGGMAQAARDRVMKKFRTRAVEFLVATDVAARGIDVDDIQAVFNYDLPYDGEDYVHRVGRTGRAGRSGIAVSFVSGREVFLIRQIERFTRQRMHRIEIPTHDEVEEARTQQLIGNVRKTMEAGDYRHYDHIIEGLLEEGIDSMALANALLHHLCGANEQAQQNANANADRDREREREFPAQGQPGARWEESSGPGAGPGRRPERGPGAESRPWKEAREPREPRVPRDSREPRERRDARDSRDARPARPARDFRSPESRPAASPGAGPGAAPRERSRDRDVRGEAGPRDRDVRGPQSSRDRVRPGRDRDRDAAPAWKKDAAPRPMGGETGPKVRPGQEVDESEAGSGRQEWSAPAAGPRERPGKKPVGYDKAGERPAWKKDGPGAGSSGAAAKPASRRTPAEMTRLWLGVGKENGISPGDIKGCILGETGIPTGDVGFIDFRDRHSFVDVAKHQAAAVVSKLKRAYLGGRKLKVKLATLNTTAEGEG